jgi:PAS domain S-box-containing protein
MDTSPEAVVLVDFEGRIVEVSRAALRLHGVDSGNDVIGTLATDWVAPESLDRFAEMWAQRFEASKVLTVELTLMRRDGSRYIAELHTATIPGLEGGASQLIAVIRDMTQRYKALEALRLSEERYRRFSALTSDLMFSYTIDNGGRQTLEWSAGSSEKITGYAIEELVRLGGLEQITNPLDRARAAQSRESLLQGRPCSDEYRIQTKDGEQRWLRDAGVYELDPVTRQPIRFYHAVQDVTARRVAEEEARCRRVELEAILDNSPSAVIVLDFSGYVSLWNSSAERILGWSRNEVQGKELPFVTPAELPGFRVKLERVVANPSQSTELRIRRKDGGLLDLLLTASPIPQEHGTFGSMVVMLTDITERKRLQEESRANEERMRAIFSSAPDLMYLKDDQLRFTHVNPAFERFHQKRAADIIGRTSEQVFTGERAEIQPAVELKVLAGQTVQNEASYSLGGADRTFEIVKVPIRDHLGRVTGICGVARDITERKRSELALRRAHTRAHQLLDVAGVIIVALAVDETISILNQRGCEILSCDPEDVLGKNWFELFLPEPEQLRFREALRRLIKGGGSGNESFESEVITRKGQRRLIAWCHSLVRDPEGTVVGTLSSGEDITDRKAAEDALRHSREMLRSVLDTVPVGVFWKDRNSVYLGCNRIYAECNGANCPEGVVGVTDYEFLPKDEAERAQASDKMILESGHSRLRREEMHLRGQRVHWLSTTKVPLRDAAGQTIGVLGIDEDITERRASETKLRQSEARFQALFDYSPVAVWEQDFSLAKAYLASLSEAADEVPAALEGDSQIEACSQRIKILGMNQSAIQIFGAPGKAQSREHLADYFGEEFLPALKTELLALVRGEQHVEVESRARNCRGEERWFDINLTVVPGYERTLEKVLVSFADITARKRAEAALRASLGEKEAMLKEIHHRVKNNLQLVSSLLRLRGNQLQNAEGKAALMDTQQRIRSMALLHEALYRSGDFAQVNLAGYLTNVAAHLFRSFPSITERIELRQNVAPLLVSLDTALPCGLIVNELLTNSLKHAFSGGGRGTVSIEVEKLDPSLVQLSVSDDGAGVPGGFVPELAQGLGLQIVSDLVRQLSGTLHYDGAAGAAFRIQFPCEKKGSRRSEG